MLKIGEFSKLSHLTVKTLRFYEKEGILKPASIDEWTGYRFYETSQLADAAKIKSYRQLGLSIDEIISVLGGDNIKEILTEKYHSFMTEREALDNRLSVIRHILEENELNYQVTLKETAECIVYYAEGILDKYSDIMQFIPECGEKCRELNPGLKCTFPPYEFCEYPDGEYKENSIRVRHNEAVVEYGKESDFIKFRKLPAVKVLSIYHKGPYDRISEAYSYIMKYAEENAYKVTGLARECYIDGIWNKDSSEDWLTEIQLPVE